LVREAKELNPQEPFNEIIFLKHRKGIWLLKISIIMELENIILSEVSLAQKTKNHMFSLICGH
jgi:hypothetical protein